MLHFIELTKRYIDSTHFTEVLCDVISRGYEDISAAQSSSFLSVASVSFDSFARRISVKNRRMSVEPEDDDDESISETPDNRKGLIVKYKILRNESKSRMRKLSSSNNTPRKSVGIGVFTPSSPFTKPPSREKELKMERDAERDKERRKARENEREREIDRDKDREKEQERDRIKDKERARARYRERERARQRVENREFESGTDNEDEGEKTSSNKVGSADWIEKKEREEERRRDKERERGITGLPGDIDSPARQSRKKYRTRSLPRNSFDGTASRSNEFGLLDGEYAKRSSRRNSCDSGSLRSRDHSLAGKLHWEASYSASRQSKKSQVRCCTVS